MGQYDKKVIGHFALLTPITALCTETDACIIGGSESAMRGYAIELDPYLGSKATVKKTRFHEIIMGMKLGAAYAFDKESYARFFPLAKEIGLPVQEADFEAQEKKGERFFVARPLIINTRMGGYRPANNQ